MPEAHMRRDSEVADLRSAWILRWRWRRMVSGRVSPSPSVKLELLAGYVGLFVWWKLGPQSAARVAEAVGGSCTPELLPFCGWCLFVTLRLPVCEREALSVS